MPERTTRRVVVDVTLSFDLDDADWSHMASPVAYVRDRIIPGHSLEWILNRHHPQVEIDRDSTREPDRPLSELVAEAGFQYRPARRNDPFALPEELIDAVARAARAANAPSIVEVWDSVLHALDYYVYLPGRPVMDVLHGADALLRWLNRVTRTESRPAEVDHADP